MKTCDVAGSKKQSLHLQTNALRLGLCRQFAREPIKVRTATVTAMLRLAEGERMVWPLTVEVEAKPKEVALARLVADLNCEGRLYDR